IDHDRLVNLVRKSFRFEKGAADRAEPTTLTDRPRVKHGPSDTGQTHFCIGYPGVSFDDREKLATVLLTTYLGGGMSSVLFQKIREARGLTYSVFAFHDAYRGSGVFGIYMATDKDRLGEAYSIVKKELSRVSKRRLSSARLDQIKNQMRGQFSLSLESTASRMSRLARNELMLGKHVTVAQTMKRIDALTSSDVLAISNRILVDSGSVIVTLGPVNTSLFDHVTKQQT
ncbi:MAG: insulinase family protein, partial [candidate division Zixibacteria bacterium]|nr:insulinase family protein [candidate division Zixibacteria bacterium]